VNIGKFRFLLNKKSKISHSNYQIKVWGAIFFLQVKTYNISLINECAIQIGRVSKVQQQDQEMVALARVWATIFACRLINLTTKFGLRYNKLLILEIRKLNSELPVWGAILRA
jgi:uncharacterized membrane protein